MKFKLSFNFNQIERDPLRLEGIVPASSFDINNDELSTFGDLRYQILVSHISGGAMVTGELNLKTKRICVRCLINFDYEILIRDINHFYKKEPDREFDLIPDLREDILLALPLNLPCSDECRGLCQICGADLNNVDCGCQRAEQVDDGIWSSLNELNLNIKGKSLKKSRGVSHGVTKKKKI